MQPGCACVLNISLPQLMPDSTPSTNLKPTYQNAGTGCNRQHLLAVPATGIPEWLSGRQLSSPLAGALS